MPTGSSSSPPARANPRRGPAPGVVSPARAGCAFQRGALRGTHTPRRLDQADTGDATIHDRPGTASARSTRRRPLASDAARVPRTPRRSSKCPWPADRGAPHPRVKSPSPATGVAAAVRPLFRQWRTSGKERRLTPREEGAAVVLVPRSNPLDGIERPEYVVGHLRSDAELSAELSPIRRGVPNLKDKARRPCSTPTRLATRANPPHEGVRIPRLDPFGSRERRKRSHQDDHRPRRIHDAVTALRPPSGARPLSLASVLGLAMAYG